MKKKILNSHKGFTLIELLVAVLIFSIITVGIVSVFVSTAGAYYKARAIKNVKENAEYAMNLIAKDVRMGKIGKDTLNAAPTPLADGSLEQYLMVARNRGGTVCYIITSTFLGIEEGIAPDPSGKIGCDPDPAKYNMIFNLTDTGMNFDVGSSGTTGFRSNPTDTTSRGWVELNLNINMTSGQEMEADQINIETIVSSRDYGWEVE